MPTENRSSNTEIKPCPFCGEKAELRCTAGPDPDWFVQCTECRASADVFSEDNLTGWNDRAHPTTSDGFSAGDMADQGAKAFAARDPEVEGLRELLRAMTCGYRMAVQAGHARITALGGDCDGVDRMLADFPEYAKAIAATKRQS